jgi:hypothetical protein
VQVLYSIRTKAKREARRRTIYTALIEQAGLTEDRISRVAKAPSHDERASDDWFTRLGDHLARIDDLVTRIRIDGSEAAAIVAKKVNLRVINLGLTTDSEFFEGADVFADHVERTAKVLDSARESLIDLARQEFNTQF